jgi:aryl-alcohol dehydrogenase-like predicted oxidoreductase
MRQTVLGRTGLACSILGLGTWGLGGRNNVSGTPVGWKSIPSTQARDTISAAIDEGINFFDCSDFYGLGVAEELLGNTIPKSNTQVVIATKVGIIPSLIPGTTKLDRNFSGRYIESALNASLTRLKRDHIDLYQLHGPSLKTLTDETWSTLERLRTMGKVRYIGVSLKSSGSNSADFNVLMNNPLVSTIQIRYNLMHIEEADFVDKAQVGDLAILARSIFHHGFLTGKYSPLSEFSTDDYRSTKFSAGLMTKVQSFFQQVGSSLGEGIDRYEIPLRYAVSSPHIALAIVGATSAEQVRENIRVSEKPVWTREERQEIGLIARRNFPLLLLNNSYRLG